MYKKIVLLVLAIAAVLMSACNKVVSVQLPDNGCNNIACHSEKPILLQVSVFGHELTK